jgi:hypothetical protein
MAALRDKRSYRLKMTTQAKPQAMPWKPKTIPRDDPEQSKLIIKKAREVGADEQDSSADTVLGQLHNRPRRIQPNLGPRKATPETRACYEPAASIAACLSMKQTNTTMCRPANVRAWRSNSPAEN